MEEKRLLIYVKNVKLGENYKNYGNTKRYSRIIIEQNRATY